MSDELSRIVHERFAAVEKRRALRIENELERKIRQEEADALNNLVRYSCDSTSGIRKSPNGPLVRLREVVEALGLRQAIDGHVEP